MVVALKNISKQIKGNLVLDDVSASFESGKIYGIFGANGSGKTMLLRAVAGLLRIDSGEIFICGEPFVFGSRPRVNIGIIIENVDMYEHLTGIENLRFLGSICGELKEERIDFLASYFDMAEHMHQKVKTYSLGMKQKLAIIQAMMEEQDLLLLDEPTNALDSDAVEKFYLRLRTLRDEGKTIILVSHRKHDLIHLCDHLLEMKKGKLYE